MPGILHLTDIHFGCENQAAVEAVGNWARAGDYQLIVITGDITQSGRREEFEDAARWVASLPQPVLVTPGNHDTPYSNLYSRAVAPFARYERFFGPAWAGGFEGQDLSVQAFNTARGMQARMNWSKGAADADHVRTVAATLGRRSETFRVAVCHHPLMEVVGGPMTGKVHGGGQAAAILARGGVDLVLSGHVHTAFAIPMPCEDALTYAVGAATLSMRERGQPPGFNVIHWDEETVAVQAKAWSGSHYESLRTWALPRRRASR